MNMVIPSRSQRGDRRSQAHHDGAHRGRSSPQAALRAVSQFDAGYL